MKHAFEDLKLEEHKIPSTDLQYTENFASVDWDEMTTYWLLFNLTNFHAVEMYNNCAERCFLSWLRGKYRQKKVNVSTEILKAQKQRLERYGYKVTLDPLEIMFMEF